jgi:exopolysaccharide biosynthesis WecB/TagA/CpsF family protein
VRLHPANVDGWRINLFSEADALVELIHGAESGIRGFTCFTLNLDHLVKLRYNAAFREAYRNADFITADGAPVARIARRTAAGVMQTAGSDLFLPLCVEAAEKNLPVFLFGSSDQVLRDSAGILTAATQGKLKVYFEAPPQDFDVSGKSADESIKRIAASGARLCFVMLGAPKQEVFASRAVEQGVKVGFICVGAAGDFIVGRVRRAPLRIRHLGLEGAWRLMQDPRRLTIRYWRCLLLLVSLEVGYKLRRRTRDDG